MLMDKVTTCNEQLTLQCDAEIARAILAQQATANLLVAYYLTDNLVRHVVCCGLPTNAMATKSVQLTGHIAVKGSRKWNLEVSTDSANNTSKNLRANIVFDK